MSGSQTVVIDPQAVAQELVQELIDLAKYPITTPDAPAYKELIASCRAQLAEAGACVLPGFVTKKAVDALASEARELAPRAHHNKLTGNAYLTEVDASIPSDDPRRLTETTSLGAVAYDQIPTDAKIRALYEWDGLMEFLAAALGKEKLFRYADPMGALNIAVMGDGDYLRWHFDQTDFVTTLLLQAPEAGGDYEFVPMIRNAINENYGKVKAILQGARDGVITLDIEPGSLVLFEGRNSLHRVSHIKGKTLRLIALLGYDTKPGTVSSDYLRRIRYGRTESVKA